MNFCRCENVGLMTGMWTKLVDSMLRAFARDLTKRSRRRPVSARLPPAEHLADRLPVHPRVRRA